MTRVAIYARYSSALQKATSIEDQVAMAKRYCDERGFTVVAVFSDEEMTGKNVRRPGFQALAAAVEAREIDLVVIEAVDRLSRRLSDGLRNWELLSFKGIGLHSISEGPQDFFTILMHGYGAQQFSKMIGDHTRRGMQGAMRRGQLHTSAYGYSIKVAENGGPNRAVDEAQARVVRLIFEMAAEGKSVNAIAKRLNADNIPSPTGKTWDPSSLRGHPERGEGILNNPLYIGRPQVCRTVRSEHPETGVRKVSLSPTNTVENHLPELQIVPDELWETVQDQLKQRRGKRANANVYRRSKYLLSGLMVCGCCGAKYVKYSDTSFKCNEARKGACENHTVISRKKIEGRVFDRLRDIFRSNELLAVFKKALANERRKRAAYDPAIDLTAAEKQLRSSEIKRDNLLRAIEEGAPYAAFKARVETVEADIAATTQRIKNIGYKMQAQPVKEEAAAAILKQLVDRMEEVLGDPDVVDEAQRFLQPIINRITLVPDPNALHGLAATIEADLAGLIGSDIERMQRKYRC